MLSETEKAYLAGIVDGEGSIGIGKSTHKNKSRFPNPTYSIYCVITNTNKELLKEIQTSFGGSLATKHEKGDVGGVNIKGVKGKTAISSKNCYWLQIYGDNCRTLLEMVMPYLRLKKKQAEIVLSFPKNLLSGQGHRLSDEELAIREKLYLQARVLNK